MQLIERTLVNFSEKLIYLDVSMLIATCPSDLTAIPRGKPYHAVTQLRETPTCKSSFSGVHLVRGVTNWVPTHASQLLVTHSGSVSTFLLYHAHGSPLGVALSWVVSVPGILQWWRGYFTRQATLPADTGILGLWP